MVNQLPIRSSLNYELWYFFYHKPLLKKFQLNIIALTKILIISMSLYRALHIKKINIVQKWPSSPFKLLIWVWIQSHEKPNLFIASSSWHSYKGHCQCMVTVEKGISIM